jgi:uncharacterized coiled-coil DUF342 family protein
MKIKRVNEIADVKMFDNVFELLNHGEAYISKVFIEKTTNWNSAYNEILNDDLGYLATSYQMKDLVERIEKELKTINSFREDIYSHIKDLDSVYQKSGELSPEDDEAYDDLEELSTKYDNMIEQIETYLERLKETSEIYSKLEDNINYLRKQNWKIP